MNVLMVGSGSGGSWTMRGLQIGKALGARIMSRPIEHDWRWADVAVLVKHAGLLFASEAHRFDVPIVWDVLDCWKQPEENTWTVEQGKAFIAGLEATIKPAVMIAATQQMAEDIGGVYIPHHCRIGLKPTPPRAQVKVVGYDGERKYLGRWLKRIEAECSGRGWAFVIHPTDLSQVDILVAFRDGKWNGPLCHAWKSGVKYVNAICSGRPIVSQRCAAFNELLPVGESLDYIEEEMSTLAYVDRGEAYRMGMQRFRGHTVEAVASGCYRPLLERIAAKVAA